MSQVARFMSKVQVCEHGRDCTDCCWPWLGAVGEGGYGRVGYVVQGHRETYAHRVAYAFSRNELAGKRRVCHSCDNPPCCNPFHLWKGTAKQNTHDSIKKGRFFRSRSQHHRPQKLTTLQVQKMRKAYTAGETTRTIAARENVSQCTVSKVVNRLSWKHVK